MMSLIARRVRFMSTRFHFHQVLMKVCNSDGQSVHFCCQKLWSQSVMHLRFITLFLTEIINSNQLSVHPSWIPIWSAKAMFGERTNTFGLSTTTFRLQTLPLGLWTGTFGVLQTKCACSQTKPGWVFTGKNTSIIYFIVGTNRITCITKRDEVQEWLQVH